MNPIKIEIKLHTLEAINYSFQVLNSPSIANRESKVQ